MRVRMLTHISGTRDGAHWPATGGQVDLPDAEAADLCRAGLAEPVATLTRETATAPTPSLRKAT